jgi:hypothetical protein
MPPWQNIRTKKTKEEEEKEDTANHPPRTPSFLKQKKNV